MCALGIVVALSAAACDTSPAPDQGVGAGNGGAGGSGGTGGSPALANIGMSYPCGVSTGGGGGGGASTASDAGQSDAAAADRAPSAQPTCVVGQSYCDVLQLKPEGSQPGLSLGGCRPLTDGGACAANPTCDCLFPGPVGSPPECSCDETQPGFVTVICQQI
jgi:hypothetical protein